MVIKTTTSFLAFGLLSVLLWLVYPHSLSAQNEGLRQLTYNLLPSQVIASGETAVYTHLLVNNTNEPLTLTLTAESANGWFASVTPLTLVIEANGTEQIQIRHTAPRSFGNGDEDKAIVHIQWAENEAEIVNRTVIDDVYGFTVAVSPNIIYTQPGTTVRYDIEIAHLGTLADEIDTKVIGVTQPLTATVEGGIGRILPAGNTLNLRLVVDVQQGTIEGTVATITLTVTSNYLSGGRYTQQRTVQTIVGDPPPTPIPTATPWTFPLPEVTNTPTPTPTPLPLSIITQDTSVWDQPYPTAWMLPFTKLDAGDEVTILYETFEWIEIAWDQEKGWIPTGIVTEAMESDIIPLTVTHSEMRSKWQSTLWGMIGAAVCMLVLITKLTTLFPHGIMERNGTSNPNR